MVKQLDEIRPPLLDHIGWHLWKTSQRWQQQFAVHMVKAGYPLFAEARSQLIPYLQRSGTRQSELTTLSGLTKQAVQQFVDQLVEDGIVERRPDPKDARGKLVAFTKKGLSLLNSANQIKKEIEQQYRRHLGVQRFNELCATLIALDGLPDNEDR